MTRTAGERRLLAVLGLLAVGVPAFGVLYEAGDRVLGTALPPFVAGWAPRADVLWLLLAAALAPALVAAVPALLRAPRAAFLVAACALGLALLLAVNAIRGGPDAWHLVLEPTRGEGRNEYLAALGALAYGREVLLDRFAEVVPALPPHPAAHPPGLLLTIDVLGLRTAGRLAALLIGAAALLPALAYATARASGLDDLRGRRAALLTAASPCVVLFGATSGDALFAALGTLAAALLAWSVRPPSSEASRSGASPAGTSPSRGRWGVRPVPLVLGALALAVASLYAWSLLAAGAWGAVLAWRRAGLRTAVVVAVACGLALLAVQGVLAAATGYDPIGTLRATEDIYRDSLARIRPYWFWSVGSPVAWAVTAGLPLVGAAAVAAWRREPAAVAIAVVVLVAAVAGFTKAETERIWLPFVPLAAVAAATTLPDRWLRPALGLLVAQAVLTSALFSTVW